MPDVRVATIADAPALAALHDRSGRTAYRHIFPPEAPPPTLERLLSRWRSWLGTETLTGFVAERVGEPLGVVLAGADPAEPSLGHLARMYVAPEHWGRGIGHSLYAVAVRHLCDAGYHEATLWVLEGNHRARSWYERLGWVATGERNRVYEPARIDELRYRLVLSR